MTYRYRLATVFLMGFFVDCINIFMPAVALPTIAAEFHVGISAGAWVANAYMLGLTLAIPLAPWLADRWGARGLMAGSMLAFALAAWACGEAGSFGPLVGWRFIQRSEEHTSELPSHSDLVCRLLLEKKKKTT